MTAADICYLVLGGICTGAFLVFLVFVIFIGTNIEEITMWENKKDNEK